MQVTLTRISNNDKISKKGKSYLDCGILTKEHDGEWINGYGDADTLEWTPGQVVEIEIGPDELKPGKLRFTKAKPKKQKAESSDVALKELKQYITKRFDILEALLNKSNDKKDAVEF